jgi:hypothetical protein
MNLEEFLEQDSSTQKVTFLNIHEKSVGQFIIAAIVLSLIPKSLSVESETKEAAIPADFEDTIDISNAKPVLLFQFYEFLDNAQFSELDSFHHQVGKSLYFISEELDDLTKVLGKKISLFFEIRKLEKKILKKSFFRKIVSSSASLSSDSVDLLRKYKDYLSFSVSGSEPSSSVASTGIDSILSKIELERSYCFPCLEAVSALYSLPLLFPTKSYSMTFELGSLESYMKLDTPASEAVNLLPKPDHPSVYGSLFGLLNRCKTKLGSKTLEKWLRQPLLDIHEINNRLSIVELFIHRPILRNQLRDGPLKNIPDLDTISSK